jgi:type I restriction enzyme S subunit
MTTKLLSELSTNISSGLTPLRSNAEFWENGTIPWLKTEQLGEKYIYETNEHISEAALEKTSLKLFPENSLSIAMYGEGKTRGNLSILKKAMATNQACCNVAIDPDKADFEYVYYFLKTQYDELRNLSSGVRKNLNSSDIKNYPIRLPENLDSQKKIANVLKALDQKIELNNRINAELEAMAKTLYDYWFVQFDFPDDSPQGQGKPYKTSGGKMIYNPTLKREIPEGWEVKKLSEIAVTGSGGTPLSSNHEFYENGTIPWINSGELNAQFIVSTANFITDLGLEKSSAKLFSKNTILMAMYGATAGKVSFIDFPAATNQAICAINPFDQEMNVYLKFTLERLYEYLINLSSGSARDNLSQDKIKSLDMVIPAQSTLTQFHEFTKSKMDLILTNLKESQDLASLRDWLLPMLMSGQVTVK